MFKDLHSILSADKTLSTTLKNILQDFASQQQTEKKTKPSIKMNITKAKPQEKPKISVIDELNSQREESIISLSSYSEHLNLPDDNFAEEMNDQAESESVSCSGEIEELSNKSSYLLDKSEESHNAISESVQEDLLIEQLDSLEDL